MRKLLIQSILFSSAALFMACDSGVDNQRSRSSGAVIDQSSADAAAQVNLTSIKVKNCDQLLRTMSKLTGVSFTKNSLKASYEENKGACPQSESLDDLSPSNISLGIKLAMDFCGAYAEKLMAEKKPASLDYSKGPKEAFTSQAKSDLFNYFITNFEW